MSMKYTLATCFLGYSSIHQVVIFLIDLASSFPLFAQPQPLFFNLTRFDHNSKQILLEGDATFTYEAIQLIPSNNTFHVGRVVYAKPLRSFMTLDQGPSRTSLLVSLSPSTP